MRVNRLYDTGTNWLGKVFYPVAIVTVLGVLVAVHLYLSTRFAVFGLYALIGLIAGAIVYYGTDDVEDRLNLRVDERVYRTAVYVVSLVTVGAVALIGEPMIVVVGLTVGYVLVIRQLFAHPTPERLVPQITLLFLLSPIVKYLTTGFYLGHGDLFFHVGLVEQIMNGQSLEVISDASYRDFPGLQLVAATLGLLSGLPPYDGLMLTGLAAYSILIPAVYLIVLRISDSSDYALYTAFAIAVLDDFSFYALYVFPQSIATILVVILVLMATLVRNDLLKWRVAGMFVFVSVALSLTHHLTQVLFAPVISLAFVLYAMHGRAYAKGALLSRQLLLVSFVGLVSLVRYIRTGFIDRIMWKITQVFSGGARGGYTNSQDFTFGQPPGSTNVAIATEWLTSAYGIYLVLLLFVFSIGVVTFLRSTDRSARKTVLFWIGALGALLIFETPISVQSLIRIRYPWLFVFAFIVGIGLLRLRERVGPSLRQQLLLPLVVLLAVTGPLVAADDYYDLDPRPTIQTSLSDREMSELEGLSQYGREQSNLTTLWLTRLGLERYGGAEIRNPQLDGRQIMLPEGHFVYRSQWATQKIHFKTGEGDELYSNTLYVSGDWLDSRVKGGNHVYTAGGTGVMWRATERPFKDM